jgi:hypothetical protein
MSDGPFKGLNMRPKWKKVAQYAENLAHSPSDIGEAIASAIATEFRSSVSNSLLQKMSAIFDAQQQSMFPDTKVRQIEALRPLTSGRDLAEVLIEHAVECASSSDSSASTLLQATKFALEDASARGGRIVEEHYLRNATEQMAGSVVARIHTGTELANFDNLARELLSADSMIRPMPIKQTGLDVGVQLD